MKAILPEKDYYKYTVFRTQIESEIISSKRAKLESLVEQSKRYLIIDEDGTKHNQLIDLIQSKSQVLLVQGAANDDRTAFRLAGQRKCIDKEQVPINVNLGPAWELDTIYSTIADRIKEERGENIKSKIKHSPPIVFFFDLDTKASRDSLDDLERFFVEADRKHKFVIFHDNPDLHFTLGARNLVFQPALRWIADHEPSRLTTALCLANKKQILDFLENLIICNRDHFHRFKIIEALTVASCREDNRIVKWFERQEMSSTIKSRLDEKLNSFYSIENLAKGQKNQIDEFFE